MYQPRRFFRLFTISVVVIGTKAAFNSTVADCSCGYYDTTTGVTWTESIIVYFNETNAAMIPSFVKESYSHKYEKGWNTQYRTGADVSNINVWNFTSAPNTPKYLALQVSPSDPDHLVVGSSVRTSRRDIEYGTFTSLLRSPGKYAGGGGSVLSFAVEYNSTQSISMNLQNTDKPSTASVSTLANDESPDYSLINYDSMINGSFAKGTLSPWDYTEYRIESTKEDIKYFIGGSLARSISRSKNEGLLSVPSTVYLRHWSNGLAMGSQGPPSQPTVADIGWVRLFFNSSLMTSDDHASFDNRCQKYAACLVHDTTLRGSSIYPEDSTKQWKQAPKNRPKKKVAIWLAVGCISFTVLLLLNPIWKRVRERLIPAQKNGIMPQARRQSTRLAHPKAESPVGLAIDFTPHNDSSNSPIGTVTLVGTSRSSPTAASFDPSQSSSTSPNFEGSCNFRRRSAYPLAQISSENESHCKHQSDAEQEALGERIPPEVSSSTKELRRVASFDEIDCADFRIEDNIERKVRSAPTDEAITIKNWRISWDNVGWEETEKLAHPESSASSGMPPETAALEKPGKNMNANPKVIQTFQTLPGCQNRVDSLAGLVVVSCLLVTAMNFNLTFLHGGLVSNSFTQPRGEGILRKTVASFLLNPIYIGSFFLTSARLLSAGYLRTGDLLGIAQKTVKRTFRLMFPVTAMVMLEYFFINCDASKWLEYLPSITWSTWPFIKGYSNFANFLSEILELMYLIPNATPVITFNYCTNVLWTIPVQLQGSWTTLLAVIIIREINTPWKRFGFYAFSIINHWYALSWGSYFYLGILLTDLDITYKWQPYLQMRPAIYYPTLFLFICFAFAGPMQDVLSQRTEVDYAAYEYGIHPNLTSGLPISEDIWAADPKHFIPRLNGLVFAVGLQSAVGISPLIQKIFSCKLFMLIFPHVFTIYLLHGFIFWTFGSWLCVFLAVRGLSYWSNILIVALCCYMVLALSTPVVTPVLDCLGKTMTTEIWRQAREEPAPRHPTLYPFSKDLFFSRCEVPLECKPSEDVGMDLESRRFSRPISRVRQPSKDLGATWYEGEKSVDFRSWYEQKPSADVNMDTQGRRVSRQIPPARNPSEDFRISWHERKPSVDLRKPWHEGEVSEPKTSQQGEKPSRDRRMSWHERKPPKNLRMSWNERKNSEALRLKSVKDVKEEIEI